MPAKFSHPTTFALHVEVHVSPELHARLVEESCTTGITRAGIARQAVEAVLLAENFTPHADPSPTRSFAFSCNEYDFEEFRNLAHQHNLTVSRAFRFALYHYLGM